jgi:hypothetical protein
MGASSCCTLEDHGSLRKRRCHFATIFSCQAGLPNFGMDPNLHITDGWAQSCQLARNESIHWNIESSVQLEVGSHIDTTLSA